jgi:hypothetical protein
MRTNLLPAANGCNRVEASTIRRHRQGRNIPALLVRDSSDVGVAGSQLPSLAANRGATESRNHGRTTRASVHAENCVTRRGVRQ